MEYMHLFVDTILHHPIEFSIYSDYFCFFANQQFSIYYSWLTPTERQAIATAFRNRRTIFSLSSSVGQDGSCCLTQCNVKGTFAIHNRRELIRDYCWMGIARKDAQIMFKFLLLHVLQRIQSHRTTPDPFVRQLQCALQGKKKWAELICVY